MMEHQEAIQLKAAERYLLGELSGDLREQFEEHFFSCSECAEDVEAGAIFVDSARQILGHEQLGEHEARIARPAKPESRGWLGNLLRPAYASSALAVLLIVFVAYQNAIVFPRMKSALSQATTPQFISSFSLIAEDSRGGEVRTIRVSRNAMFNLSADIPPEKQFPSYNCVVQTESGAPEFSGSVPAEQALDGVNLSIPPGRLKPGKYFLVVRGVESGQSGKTGQVEIARYPFTLAFTN
jgi:Putative zinc-finger